MSLPHGCCTPAGFRETMFLGADTIRPLIRAWCPTPNTVSRPRLSTLSHTGHKKVTRLPPRSAVVAFSLADVFSLAELVAASAAAPRSSWGRLSPRARNAQVGHVPGRRSRLPRRDRRDRHGPQHGSRPCRLCPPRQVRRARAAPLVGRRDRPDRRPRRPAYERRHLRHDGRSGPARPGDRRRRRGAPVRAADQLSWRNTRLRFNSVGALLRSLDERPPAPGLVQARDADDHRALQLSVAQRRGNGAGEPTPARCGCCGKSARSPISARS